MQKYICRSRAAFSRARSRSAFRVWPARRVCFGTLSEKFSLQLEFAFRFALGGLLGAMLGPLGLGLWKDHTSLYSSAAAIWFIFTSYDSLGESVKLSLAGLWGSAVGTVTAYICWEVFAANDFVVYVAIFSFTFIIFSMPVHSCFKMFACSMNNWLLMLLVNDHVEDPDQTLTRTHFRAAWWVLLYSCFGLGLSVVVMAAPLPRWCWAVSQCTQVHDQGVRAQTSELHPYALS